MEGMANGAMIRRIILERSAERIAENEVKDC
jgi:hypothetical protein